MNARKFDNLRAAAQRTAPTTPAPGVTAIDTSSIRTTLDLDRSLWSDVQTWMSEAQSALRRRVHKAQVFRALLTLLVTDPDTAAKVRDLLKQ